jgi:(p)ppGpp synthase/HD superfamily hydrolase
MPVSLTSRFDCALDLAASLHRNQFRKGSKGSGIPYLSHLLMVASIVLEDGGSEEAAIAALLHDGPEDQGGRKTLKLIEDQLGPRVAEIVRECTDTLVEPKPKWLPRKRRFLAKLRKVKDREILLVKCADGLANARATLWDHRTVGDEVWSKFGSMPCSTNQLWWYANCVDALRPISDTRAWRQVRQVVTSLLMEVEPCKRRTGVHAQHMDIRLRPTSS